MKYPSPADIAEMKARGYERATIEKAEEQSKRWLEAQAVCSVIRAAFKEVKLGGGVGLTEAQGLDDYEDAATCAAYREKDEKENWECVSFDDLSACHSSLSFFDAEGMRFHLPAYLIADLEGEYEFGMASRLTDISELRERQFSLLNDEQRMAVRRYLFHIRIESHYFNHRADIDESVESYWKQTPEPRQQ